MQSQAPLSVMSPGVVGVFWDVGTSDVLASGDPAEVDQASACVLAVLDSDLASLSGTTWWLSWFCCWCPPSPPLWLEQPWAAAKCLKFSWNLTSSSSKVFFGGGLDQDTKAVVSLSPYSRRVLGLNPLCSRASFVESWHVLPSSCLCGLSGDSCLFPHSSGNVQLSQFVWHFCN